MANDCAMYQVESASTAIHKGRSAKRPWYRMGAGVLLLGLTSLLTDISSEMVSTILPAYLLFGLRLGPFQVGLIDGLYQGASVLVRFVSGMAVDAFRVPKWIAVIGYALSALSRVGFLTLSAGGFGAVVALVTADRIGKGIRTSPRDVMIAASVDSTQLGTAFGVHRAMDTIGAMAGPLLAFAILSWAHQSYQTVFIVSLCFAVLGVAVLTLFVPNTLGGGARAKRLDLRKLFAELKNARYRSALLGASLLALFTLSEGLIYLNLQQKLALAPAIIPLLFVASGLTYVALAVPIGALADRIGRGRVFAAGHVCLLAAYGSLLAPRITTAALGPWLEAALVVALSGTFHAATDGVITAQVSAHVDEGARGTAIALLATGVGIGHLIASALFGAIWSGFGPSASLLVFMCGMTVALVAFLVLTHTTEHETTRSL